MKEFKLFLKDLKPETQKDLLKFYNTTEEEGNWDSCPIAFLESELEEFEDGLESEWGRMEGLDEIK